MAGQSRVEQKVAQIAALGGTATLGEDAACLLRDALASANSLLIGAAAKIVRTKRLAEQMPDVIKAFLDLLDRPAKADKGCLAKAALAESLNALDCHEEPPFVRGVAYVQVEPSYGRQIETAGAVRAECALGLARMQHPQGRRLILPLLVDGEPMARAGAVRALAYLGGEAGELLLRLKALVGDEHPAVVGECLQALLKMDPVESAGFVATFLESADTAIVEEAAMALASLQDAHAARLLCQCRTSRQDPAFRERMLVPIAMTRCQEALEALCAVIVDGPTDDAVAAVKAAAMHRSDPRWVARITQAVAAREDAVVQRTIAEQFA